MVKDHSDSERGNPLPAYAMMMIDDMGYSSQKNEQQS